CEVPIKEVLENGCRIAKVQCDLEKVKVRIAAIKAEIESEQESIRKLRNDIGLLSRQLAGHREHFEELDAAVKSLERSETDRSQSVQDARNVAYDVERYSSMVSSLESFER